MQLMSELMVGAVLEEVSKRPETQSKSIPHSMEARRKRERELEVEAGLRLAHGGMPNRKQRRAAAAFARKQAKVSP